MPRQEYRDYALECVRLAERVGHPSLRVTLLEMAQAWLRLYDQSEKNSQLDLVYETPEPGDLNTQAH